MSAIERTYEQIIAYLKGLLTNRQRHNLEKKMMQDAFEEEAFEGLSQMDAGELEADMDLLAGRLQERIKPARKRYLIPLLRIAAAVIVIFGVTGLLYFLLRPPSQDLFTQSLEKPETSEKSVSPAVPGPADNDSGKPISTEQTVDKSRTGKSIHPVLAENRQETEDIAEAVHEMKTTIPQISPVIQHDLKYLDGKVVDIDGEALPGVTITEKGSSRGVITDLDGNFSIQVGDTGSEILLSYVGYEPMELNARDISDKPITMKENLMALEEVVVVGYGTRKKSDVTGAARRMEAEEATSAEATGMYNFVNPVPPGGTLKAFKNWVSERIDSVSLNTFPGKHKLQVILTIQHDGSIHDILIRSNAPSPVIEEYKRVIAQSPPWKPALKDDDPVASEVVIRFVFTVE
ncbi:MAG: carboxypeptidase-like regulatory domain-containing protein [Bacteroidales bacterium]|nr:carboxypeptidase-like regulatory domain-containing protein [Bacteroidales bacterium]